MLDQDAILAKMMGELPAKKPAPRAAKPKYTAAEVSHYLKIKALKSMGIHERIGAVEIELANGLTIDEGCEHPACRLGVYVGTLDHSTKNCYFRMCKRCQGKGELDTKDIARNYTYDSAKARGVSKVNYKQHNSSNNYVYGVPPAA